VIRHLNAFTTSIRDMFSLPPAPALTIYSGILFVIPGLIVVQYRSLYLASLGLSDTEVGIYSFGFIPLGILCLWIGGYLADTWGRKRTLFLFDSISWIGYCLLLALARDKWWAVGALLLFATNQGSSAPYQCLLVEGVPVTRRAVAYSVLQIVNFLPALLFFPLLGGWWVEQKGINAAGHGMFWLFLALTSLGIGIRLVFMPHSGAYERPPRDWRHALETAFVQYRRTIVGFFKKPAAVPFLCSRVIDEWLFGTWAIYSSLYFVHHLGLQEASLAVLTQVSAYVVCVALVLLLPRIPHRWTVKLLGWDQVLGGAGFLILLFYAKGENTVFGACLVSSILVAIGFAFYSSINAAVWMNLIGERERAKVVVVSVTLFQVAIWVLGSLSALLFGKVSPPVLLAVMIGMRVVDFFLLRKVSSTLESSGSF
jgi:MFS family permease